MKTMPKLILAALAATTLALGARAETIDLSTLTANYTAQTCDVLTGTLAENVRISIADGATVTIHDANINGVDDESYPWAGLNCLGDATIVLSGENVVKGFFNYHPGIHVLPEKTLTIRGDGSLVASSNGNGAGIGGGGAWHYYVHCGNIVIESGTITATGGYTGIGAGYSRATCGDITINGGTVTATATSSTSAGIGSGYESTCGNITIGKGVTRVTATRGYQAASCIGRGLGGSCGTVTIAPNLRQTAIDYTLIVEAVWNGEGTGTEDDPYIVTDAASLQTAVSCGLRKNVFVKLADSNTVIEGPLTVPIIVDSLAIDLNGGSITGAAGQAAIMLAGDTAFAATGTGTISADSGVESVKRLGSVTIGSGVTATGIGDGGSVPAPAFEEGGASEIVKFAQAEGGKWTITAFAELGNASVGEEVAPGQVKVYAADTVDGLDAASALTEGVAVENKSAVKSTIQVTAPGGKDSQFFKVKFGE